MREPPRTGERAWRGRNLLRLWHRWFGLGAVLWLLLLSVTGSAIVFYDELDRWLNPDWRIVALADQASPKVDAAIGEAQRGVPGFQPRFVDLPNQPDETIMMIGSVPDKGPVQVFADPRDGRLLGWREGEVFSFDRRHLMDTLYALHLDLMLGPVMTWFLGLIALLWTIDHGVAAILSVPRLAKFLSAFRVQGVAGSLRRIFDLHRASGMWLFPLTLVLAVSGLTLTWHEETRAAVRLVLPVSERLHESFPDRPITKTIGLDAAIAAVAQTGANVDSVLIVGAKGVYGVRSFDPRDLDGIGRLWTYISMADGAVIGQRHDNGQGAADTFFAWQYPLHSGKAFGIAGRLAVLAGGLFTIGLCFTGLWLWWRRRKAATVAV